MAKKTSKKATKKSSKRSAKTAKNLAAEKAAAKRTTKVERGTSGTGPRIAGTAERPKKAKENS
jgi:hypothetical protein